MELDNGMVKLIKELEYRIADNCYNPNSYDGWTGDEGRNYRYPVCYSTEDGYENKTKYVASVDEENVHTMKYKFGSNHLYIGKGIIEVLSYIEEIYGIDFNELEKKRKIK